MLIQFSVANFKSIKEEQIFSMVASKNKELIDSHTFDAPLVDKSAMKLLHAAAIYGPNASGKTNLLQAFWAIQDCVLSSAVEKNRGEPLSVIPFRLHSDSRNAPSKFAVMFIVEGIRYQYGFAATAERVTDESLFAYPAGRSQRWFTRTWDGNQYDWYFGASLLGEKSIWQKATRDNALFLSTAVQLNSEQLQPVYDWFKNILHFASSTSGVGPGFSASFYAAGQEDGRKEELLNFLKQADLGIDDIYIKEKSISLEDLPPNMSDAIKKDILKEMKTRKIRMIKTIHQDANGESIVFDLSDESDGTQRIFSFAGPWIDSLAKGKVLCFDELHDNLHPALVAFLVRYFNNPQTNPNHAQLIFTTHETSMLNQDTLRRDQIWFCEKDKTKATQVFPLSDFRPRKGHENLEASYLSGRYGALPYIAEMQR